MRAYLGIDIGTFEAKGVLVDATGRILASAARRHRMLVPEPGWAEHRPIEDWWDGLREIAARLLAETQMDPREIRGVGVSAIGPCMLPVDAAGAPLGNAVLYGVDTRAAREIAELTERIGEARLIAHGGNRLTAQSVGPKILWLQRNRPEIFARAARFHTATSFLVERLTGAAVMDHFTAAGFTPLYDATARVWAVPPELGWLEPARLPRLGEATDIAGVITREAAVATGLAAGTPVTVGTIDAAAEAFSVGVTAPGEMMLMYGSTIFTILLTEAPVFDARLWYAPWLRPGLHASQAGLATSGTLTQWFREHFARELPAETAMTRLAEEAAATPPGAAGLVVLPYFSGERTPIHDPQARGCVFGLDLTHTRGHLFRAVLEGIACSVRHALSAYAEAPRRVLVAGGGTRNPVWMQAVSDVCGLEQIVPRETIGASLGDAMLAALAVGDADPAALAAWNPARTCVTPRAELAALYGAQFSLYRRLYEQTKDLMAALPRPG